MAEESRMAVVDRTFDAMVQYILRGVLSGALLGGIFTYESYHHYLLDADRWTNFIVQVQQTITNTSGYKMSKKDLFLLCPEISPESRRSCGSRDLIEKRVKIKYFFCQGDG